MSIDTIPLILLAAGFGKRMHPLTLHTPKPLITVKNISLLDRAIMLAKQAGIKKIFINCHYLADQFYKHIATYEHDNAVDITLIYEEHILETGGGVRNILPYITTDVFFVMNSDSLVDATHNPFTMLYNNIKNVSSTMAAHLVISTQAQSHGFDHAGDFIMNDTKNLYRYNNTMRDETPYYFSGIQLLYKSLFDICPDSAFSLNIIYDKAGYTKNLYGCLLDGQLHHVGTKKALQHTESLLCI